jgi:hypothetical protein
MSNVSVPFGTSFWRPNWSLQVCKAGLEALGHPEVGALVLALDLLQERSLDPAVGHVGDPHLPGERTARDQHRLARGVRDLVVRQPEGRRRRPLVVEAAGLTVRAGREVVVELARLDVDQLVGRQPAALVVGGEDRVLRSPADAVRRAQAAGDVLDLARVLVDLQVRAAIVGTLRHGRRAAEVDRDRKVQVEEAVLVEQTEAELVEVAVERPGRDLVLLLVDPVRVGVDQLGQLMLLGDVDVAVDDLDAHRLAQALGDLRGRHVGGIVCVLDTCELPHLAGCGHTARVAVVVAPGEHEQVVAHPLQAGHLRLEAGRPQIDQVIGGVDAVERKAVAGRVDVALALLRAGRGDAHDARVGAQHLVGDDAEGGGAGRPPAQRQLLTATRFEEVDAQRVHPGGELDVAVLGGLAVQPVVVDHEPVVDEQLRPVVAREPERVGAGGRHGHVRDHVHDEVVGEAAEVAVTGPIDRRPEHVDVRRLALFDRADLAQRAGQLEDTLRDARLLRRRVLCVGPRRCRTEQHDQTAQRKQADGRVDAGLTLPG